MLRSGVEYKNIDEKPREIKFLFFPIPAVNNPTLRRVLKIAHPIHAYSVIIAKIGNREIIVGFLKDSRSLSHLLT